MPPTLGLAEPNRHLRVEESAFYLNDRLRPWPVRRNQQDRPLPRRAGVSAFGFGGTNFHAVLEEYVPGRYRDESAARTFAAAHVPPATVRAARWRAESRCASGVGTAVPDPPLW